MDTTHEIDPTDHELMQKIALGDEKAFTTLLIKYQNPVIHFMMKMLNDYQRAEDLTQVLFVRIWKHACNYRPDAKFTTYLYTIAKNLVYTESSSKSKRKEISAEAIEGEHSTITSHPRTEPDHFLQQQELEEAIDRAIAALPEQQRTAIILRRYENMPYEEIASILNVSVPSLKSILFRARTQLKESLAKYLNS